MTVNQTDEYIVKSDKPAMQIPDISVPELLAKRISTIDPNIPALIDPNNNGNLNYGQLHQQAQEFARALLELNVTKDDFVMFYAENSLEHIVAMLGSIYLGLKFCPIPPASGPFELTQQTKGSSGTVLVFGSEKMATVEKACCEPKYSETMAKLKVLVQLECNKPDKKLKEFEVLSNASIVSFVDVINSGTVQVPKTIPHFAVASHNESYCMAYTSGTTGTPKGAMHTHRSMAAAIMMTDFGDRALAMHMIMWHPLGHISGTFFIQYALSAGSSVIVFAKSDIEPILQAVERFKVKGITISADQASQLANIDFHKKYDLTSLAFVNHGGSLIASSILLAIREKYNVATTNLYGSTEFLCPVNGCIGWSKDDFKPGCVGQVKAGIEMKIVDLESGKSLPANQTGEICFRGIACFLGYLNNEIATQSTIINGWYHSGDVGYYDENNCLFITDRIKEMIKYKLYSLIPAEIEDFIHSHKKVEAVCVVGVPHVTDGNHIRAYVKLMPGQTVTEQEIIDYVAANLGSQKKIRNGVKFIDHMPRGSIGKVDRQYFKRLVKDELLTEPVD